MNRELSDIEAGFRKGRGTRNQIANIHDHQKSKRIPEKPLLLLTDYAKAFHCVDHHTLWKILKETGIPPPELSLEKSVYRSGSNI